MGVSKGTVRMLQNYLNYLTKPVMHSAAHDLYFIPVEMIGSQNKFFSPPTPIETHGRDVTVCPANICWYHSNTFSITGMLSAYYTL
jgi:hypothetical protein